MSVVCFPSVVRHDIDDDDVVVVESCVCDSAVSLSEFVCRVHDDVVCCCFVFVDFVYSLLNVVWCNWK